MRSRRSLLRQAAFLGFASHFTNAVWGADRGPASTAQASVELVHRELWRRFVDKHGVLLDFTELDGSVSLPTPEECRQHKPNAIGWWTPIENGAMFNGLYLDGAVNRAKASGADADHAKARTLVDGLLRLASCSNVRGFVGRGFAIDGKTTWALGSNDQTGPWFYGLWRYVQSGLADDASRARIVAKMTEVADALVSADWRIPCEPPFNWRGSFGGITWNAAPRMLFICKAMHSLTGDDAWGERYRTALTQTASAGGPSRLAVCERGMVFEKKGEAKPSRATWTGSPTAACLRGLWEMEQDEATRTAYGSGLAATAALAAEGMSYRKKFYNDEDTFYEPDWRKINVHWRPQQTNAEAEAVARAQLDEINKLSPRRRQELKDAREAVFAAWVVTLCPDATVIRRHETEILETIAHFRADRLRCVSFFPLESAWWRLSREK